MDADDQNALLLFRVGPVCCCAPSRPVAGVVTPPPLHRPPGSDALHPGVFRHGGHLVKVVDLGEGFGAPIPEGRAGRIIVAELPSGRFGFRVDDIIDVLEWPAGGWAGLPPPIPRTWFRRTLLHDGRLCLYTEFERLAGIEETGILREHLRTLEPEAPPAADPEPPPAAGCSRPAEPEPRAVTAETRRDKSDCEGQETVTAGPKPSSGAEETVTPPPARTESRTIPQPAATVSGNISDPGTMARHPPPSGSGPAPGGTSGKAERPSPAAASRPRQPVPPRAAEPPSRPSAPDDALAGSTPPPATQPPPAVPASPASPPATGESVLPAMLLIVFILAGVGTGSWYLLTGWLAPEPPRTLVLAAAEPVSLPGPVAVSTETRRNPVVSDTPLQPAPLAPVLSEPALSEPPAPEPINPPASPSSQYRAEIRDDDEGITIVLHQPRPSVPPPEESGRTVHDGTPMPSATTGLQEPGAERPNPAEPGREGTETDTAAPKPSSTAAAADTTAPKPRSKTEAPGNGASTPSPAPVIQREIVHIVVRGDTLWDIAARYVHDPFRYPELARLSRIRDPDRIYPGDRVRILVVQAP